VDFSRPAEEPVAAPAAEPRPEAEIRGVALLWARKLRLDRLLEQSRPIRVATLRYRIDADDATYDLEAMRGIVPGTIAWALYHRGEEAPVETGTVDAGDMSADAWVTFRSTTAAGAEALLTAGAKTPLAVALPLRWIAADHLLLLQETEAPPSNPTAEKGR
jgi:hypothetical protein